MEPNRRVVISSTAPGARGPFRGAAERRRFPPAAAGWTGHRRIRRTASRIRPAARRLSTSSRTRPLAHEAGDSAPETPLASLAVTDPNWLPARVRRNFRIDL